MFSDKEKLKEYLGFDDIRFLLIGIPLLSFLIPILFFKGDLSNGLVPYLPKWGISLMYTTVYWLTTRYAIIALRKRFPAYTDTIQRIVYTLGASVVLFFIFGEILDFVHFRYFHENDNGISEFDYDVASLTILLLCATVYETIFLYARWKRTILETEQLKRDHIQSQLEGLKSQVNPHFLFNSLNTLVYIIPEDPDRAITFVQKLSKVYRYVLEIRDKKLIPLQEEITFLHAYIFLLEERFGESLKVTLDIPEILLEAQVVPLSLQILFENAIKHNIISRQKPLHIEVEARGNNFLIVRNNLQEKRQKMPSTKVGLENIKNRYAFFSQEKVEIVVTAQHFSVELPLLRLSAQQIAAV